MSAAGLTSLPIPEISCVNPLQHQRALEQLFAEHERADHSEFFERAYPGAVAEGAKAWIGADAEGRVVMHASRFPHSFVFGGRRLTGGLIVNILVAKPYRTHHPARALFERFVADSRKDGQIDFLYTETTDRGANVLTAAGARTIGRVGRFVLPIRGAKPAVDVAIRTYQGLRGLGTGVNRLKATCHPAATFSSAPFDAPIGDSDRLRGIRRSRPVSSPPQGLPDVAGPLDHRGGPEPHRSGARAWAGGTDRAGHNPQAQSQSRAHRRTQRAGDGGGPARAGMPDGPDRYRRRIRLRARAATRRVHGARIAADGGSADFHDRG